VEERQHLPAPDSERQMLRASDADREQVVARLRVALDEGRLKMDEYLERMGLAYDAVTYADLAALYVDLPGTVVTAAPAAPARTPDTTATPVAQSPAAPARRNVLADLPAPLKVLWTIWLTAVSINVVVWVLVSATTAQLIYPWPIWVAGPWGAALFGISVGATRGSRRRTAPRLPPPSHADPGAGPASLAPRAPD
jgi:hypothetical protein